MNLVMRSLLTVNNTISAERNVKIRGPLRGHQRLLVNSL